MLGHRHAVRERPQVVAAECGPQRRGVLHQKRRRRLVAGVGLPLLLPDGHGPAGSLGVHGLEVPVGALHQPDPDRRAAVAGPRGQRLEVAERLAEIALHDHPTMRPVAKLLLHGDLFEDGQREVLRGMALHVDVDLRVIVAGQPPERSQPRQHALSGAKRVDGVKLAVERGELQRHVHPRHRPAGAIVDERIAWPRRGEAGQFGEQLRVGCRVGIGFRFARDRLAEQVEREAAVMPPLGECRPRRLGGIRPGDEPAGLGEHSGPDRPGGQRREQHAP